MPNFTATSYGLHWDGNVAWLLQGRGGTNFVGLKAQCPFRGPPGMCNHLVPTAAPIPDKLHWEALLEIMEDPLVKAMLPIPREGGSNAFYLEDPYDDLGLYISTLSRLSSPINPVVKPGWTFKMKDLERELTSSNIQPLCLVQMNQKNQGVVDAISKAAAYSPRTILLAGTSEVVVPKPFQRIESQIRKYDLATLMTLPMETIGAALIRRFARREQLDTPIESRDQRRQRMISERNN